MKVIEADISGKEEEKEKDDDDDENLKTWWSTKTFRGHFKGDEAPSPRKHNTTTLALNPIC